MLANALTPRRLRGRLLWPAAGGVLLALAFPPWRLWPLAFTAWVPLWLTLAADAAERPAARPRARRTFLEGWLMGFAAFVLLLYWILWLSNEEVTIPGLMIPGLALLALYLGIFFGLAALAIRWLHHATGAPLLLVAPPVTLLFEWLRDLGPLGFPWGAPAYAFARVTPLLQPSAITGFWGLVLLVLVVNALLAAGLRGSRWCLPAAAGLLALWWIDGAAVLARHPEGALEPGRRALKVLVAQPDIRREIKWKKEKREEVTRLVYDHALQAAERGRAAGGFDLFVWPETVLPTLVLQDPAERARLDSVVARIGAPVLLGAQEVAWGISDSGRNWLIYNSAAVVHPDGGASPTYRKMKLVPFSERMPLQRIAPWLAQIDFGQSDFSAGTEPVLLNVLGEKAGCLICFESVFPEVSAEMVRRGATLLVNITNDFWFGRTAGPMQHAEMSILRAVENRVPLVRCANTGVSFVVDPWGRVREERGIFTQADFVASIACGAGSFASRHPQGLAAAWLAWMAAALLAGGTRRRGARRASRPGGARLRGEAPARTAGEKGERR